MRGVSSPPVTSLETLAPRHTRDSALASVTTLPYVCSRLEFSASPRSAQQAGSNGLRLITQGETLYSFSELRDDLASIGLANYVTELLDWVLPPDKPQENLYILGVSVLLLLAAVQEPRQQYLLLKFFEIQLLNALGWRLQLENCARCGSKLMPLGTHRHFTAAPALGGVVCRSCRKDLAWSLGANSSEPQTMPGESFADGISLGGIKILTCLQSWEPRRFLQLHYQADLRRELNQTLWACLDYHLGRGSQKARQNLLLYCSDIII